MYSLLNHANETTYPWWNPGIVAQDLNLAAQEILSLIPGFDPILLNGDIKFGEVYTETIVKV